MEDAERLRAPKIDADMLRDLFVPTRDQMMAEGATKLTRRHVITLANMIRAWPMAVVWKLEKLGLVKRRSYEWLKDNGGITKAQIAEVETSIETITQ